MRTTLSLCAFVVFVLTCSYLYFIQSVGYKVINKLSSVSCVIWQRILVAMNGVGIGNTSSHWRKWEAGKWHRYC